MRSEVASKAKDLELLNAAADSREEGLVGLNSIIGNIDQLPILNISGPSSSIGPVGETTETGDNTF